ncbi:MAG: hypothetical protein J6Z01_01690 [Bacteroidales bacterium]|nr:hypothetical protein [Bacteroidales bacterium]
MQIDIGKLLKDSWEAFSRNIVFYILSCVLCLGVSFAVIPFCFVAFEKDSPYSDFATPFLTIALLVVYIMVLIYALGVKNCALISAKGGNAGWKNLFLSFTVYFKLFLAWLLVYVAIFVGSSFCMLPGLVLLFLMQFVTLCIYDDPDKSIIDAMKESVNLCYNNFLTTVVCSFVIWIIASVSVFTIIGIFVALPFQEVALATLYVKLKELEDNRNNAVPPAFNPNYPAPPEFYGQNNG